MPKQLRISTIDSFQGQEKTIIEQLVSLKVTQQPLSRGRDGSSVDRTIASFDEIDKSLNSDTAPIDTSTPSPAPTTP